MITSSDGLTTNTRLTSIDITQVLDGGSGKDGITSIDSPNFVAIDASQKQMPYLTKDSLGISVKIDDMARFYPYEILVWHEIVNDSIGDNHFSVTFCPLCGSAIVYNREIEGEILEFGVSGKLYQSNLLMYDDKTESLWSQSVGKRLIGDFLGLTQTKPVLMSGAIIL